MPGIADVLDRLAVRFCVATYSSPIRVRRSLALVGVWDRFEGHVFTASEVANGKPAPDLFLHAADPMGAGFSFAQFSEFFHHAPALAKPD